MIEQHWKENRKETIQFTSSCGISLPSDNLACTARTSACSGVPCRCRIIVCPGWTCPEGKVVWRRGQGGGGYERMEENTFNACHWTSRSANPRRNCRNCFAPGYWSTENPQSCAPRPNPHHHGKRRQSFFSITGWYDAKPREPAATYNHNRSVSGT